MSSSTSKLGILGFVLLGIAVPSVALAAPGGAGDEAQELRERAEAEMATGNLAEACPLLGSAYALDQAATTLALYGGPPVRDCGADAPSAAYGGPPPPVDGGSD